jgi:hypothetical protein
LSNRMTDASRRLAMKRAAAHSGSSFHGTGALRHELETITCDSGGDADRAGGR